MHKHLHSQEYKRGQLVQAAYSLLAVPNPFIEDEFKRQAKNLLQQNFHVEGVQLTTVAALIIFAAEGYIPDGEEEE